MKTKLLLTLLLISLLLFGCLGPTKDSLDNNTSIRQDGNSNIELLESQLTNCLRSKSICEGELKDTNCPLCEECPLYPALSDCNSVTSILGQQLSDCSAQKGVVLEELNQCEKKEEDCSKSLATKTQLLDNELSKKIDMDIQHYVPGNLGVSGDYRQIQSGVGFNTKIVAVGLEYDGGSDDFFAEGLLSGLVRWYELTINDTNQYDPVIMKSVYESESGDTVLIEQAAPGSDIYYLKIKSDEFNANTSKEGHAIRRILIIYTNYSKE